MSLTPADAGTFTRIIQKQTYATIAASSGPTTLGATGSIGDLIGSLTVIPATTSPGAITLTDGATAITVFAGGATSVADLKPFTIPLNIEAKGAGWKVTTGANVSVIAAGVFT